jgi:hypothetical protein
MIGIYCQDYVCTDNGTGKFLFQGCNNDAGLAYLVMRGRQI